PDAGGSDRQQHRVTVGTLADLADQLNVSAGGCGGARDRDRQPHGGHVAARRAVAHGTPDDGDHVWSLAALITVTETARCKVERKDASSTIGDLRDRRYRDPCDRPCISERALPPAAHRRANPSSSSPSSCPFSSCCSLRSRTSVGTSRSA